MTKEQLKVRSQWEHRDYNTVAERTGVLRIRMNRGAGNPKDFMDAANAPLETRLNDVMIWLFRHSITVAERERRTEEARVAAAERVRKERDAEIAHYKAEEKRPKEKERVAGLMEQAQQLRKAADVRA